MGESLTALLTYFLPREGALEGEVLRRHRLMVAFLLVTASYAVAYVPVSILIEYRSALVAIPLTAVICVLLAFGLRNGVSMVVVCNSYLVVLSIMISFVWVSTGAFLLRSHQSLFSGSVQPSVTSTDVSR